MLSTAAIIPYAVQTAVTGIVTKPELRQYVDNGNMCVAHGPSLSAGNLFTQHATDDLALADMTSARDWLLGEQLTNSNGAACYAWPQGVFTRTAGDAGFLDTAYAAGFRLGRNASPPDTLYCNLPHAANTSGNLLMTTIGHSYAGAPNTADDAAETTNVDAIITRIQGLASSGSVGFLMLHSVVAKGAASDATHIEVDRLHAICAAVQTLVAAGTLECVTMDQLVPPSTY